MSSSNSILQPFKLSDPINGANSQSYNRSRVGELPIKSLKLFLKKVFGDNCLFISTRERLLKVVITIVECTSPQTMRVFDGDVTWRASEDRG